jgi:hypothetical protein
MNFAHQNPLGRRLILWKDNRPARDMEIVGVSKNARYGDLKNQIPPVVYMPYDQGFPQPNELVYALRTAGDPLACFVSSERTWPIRSLLWAFVSVSTFPLGLAAVDLRRLCSLST